MNIAVGNRQELQTRSRYFGGYNRYNLPRIGAGMRALICRMASLGICAAAIASSMAVPEGEVLNGIDVLEHDHFAPLKGLKVGLITNHTGKDGQGRTTIDLLKNAPDVTLVALFSPEHGIRGDRDEKVGDSVDMRTGLPIHSLYGETRRPQAEDLRGIEALVFDIQDIGCRFYTYISTMQYGLEAAGRARIKFFVLDRVNPINGTTLDGPVLSGKTSFTACHPLAVRHGMTVGELARMFNAELGWKADLTVIPVSGWSRAAWFDQTGLPWINPSPNMRSLRAAALYPGVGLLETTSLSVGRGTDTPFEQVGAPYIDENRLTRQLNEAGIAGVQFEPVTFTPTASVFKDQTCHGVRIILTDRDHCPVVDIGLSIARCLQAAYGKQFNLDKFNVLLVHPATIEAIKAGNSLAEIRQLWAADLKDFAQRRAKYLLYP